MANPFFETPRTRRLRKDLQEMKALLSESTILEFEAQGDAPSEYKIVFHGDGLESENKVRHEHRVSIRMGAEYPRTVPDVTWETPILHPNIRGAGSRPCFGTFAMNPNVRLTEIVEILWDMGRLAVYNPYGGYDDRDLWSVLRKKYGFPIDKRILRDKAPVVEAPPRPAGGEDDVDLIIMSGYSLGGLPPSQVWVKAALEQYLESRGVADFAKVMSADEWYAETGGNAYGMVAAIDMAPDLAGLLAHPTEHTQWLADDFRAFVKRLGLSFQASLRPRELLLVSGGR